MKTILYEQHRLLGAKLVDFAGWEMPINYKGIIAEHMAVRGAIGLFDVSHMGRILVRGPDAENLIDKLSTNHIKSRPLLSATYTVWCHDHGGSVDDVMIYKSDNPGQFYLVFNAGNRKKDFQHIQKHAQGMDVYMQDYFSGYGILALQGPRAASLLSELFPEVAEIKPMRFIIKREGAEEILISRTGYTGAGGFEIFASDDRIIHLWERLLQDGKKYGIEPAGLGARDTLRLEMGFALYGHELNDEIAPTESVSAWTVKFDKADFLGKAALEKLENNPKKRHAYGVKLIDRGIARQGCQVIKNDQVIGLVTSGSFSPTLNEAIALILVQTPLLMGEMIEIQIRQSLCQAQVIQLPFVRKSA
jgi:aminomethyltransferase